VTCHVVDSSVWIAYLRDDNLIEVEVLAKALCTMSMGGRHATFRESTHAVFGGIPLLHHDRDFNLIASVEPKLILVSARA
jgi:hypothetical protein